MANTKALQRTLDQFPANTIQYTVCTGYAEDAYYMLWDKYSQTHVPNTTSVHSNMLIQLNSILALNPEMLEKP